MRGCRRGCGGGLGCGGGGVRRPQDLARQHHAFRRDAVAASVDGVTDGEVVFGTHTDLTGPIAIWGVGIVNGARMRFDAANEAGGVHGRQIRYIVEDTQYQVPRAISASNKLIRRLRNTRASPKFLK